MKVRLIHLVYRFPETMETDGIARTSHKWQSGSQVADHENTEKERMVVLQIGKISGTSQAHIV